MTVAPGRGDEAAAAVLALGGEVRQRLDALDVLIVDLDSAAWSAFDAAPSVVGLSADQDAELAGTKLAEINLLYPRANTLLESVDAGGAWALGYRGDGVDVAIVDSGVSPVAGLSGRIVNGADFSSDAGTPKAYLDGLGHGTTMAAIVAGNDAAASFAGVAPAARIVNVKVADQAGQATLTTVLAGIDWVMVNRRANGLNIKVMNLSLGYTKPRIVSGGDPLATAAEKAWKSGIVVVAAVGNDGSAKDTIAIPARNPYVIAVGASDTRGTSDPSDDSVAPFSSRAHGRSADLVAPGVGVLSVRVEGSVIDTQFPGARQGSALFRGNGTSQSTAVVSGGAALLLNRYPNFTPDQVKTAMMRSTSYLLRASRQSQGSGELNIGNFMGWGDMSTQTIAAQYHNTTGGLLTSRSGGRAANGDQPVSVNGNRWTGNRWTGNRWTGNRWTGGAWLGDAWG